jgi:signal transduction histidine kinase
MWNFFLNLFDTSDFPQRWYCGNWSDSLGWFTILSDIGVWSAYTAIPAVLAYFMIRRRDLPFPRIVWLFVAFIYSCGATHLIEALIFWWPAYRLSAAVKFITAVVSWATVIALIRVAPAALRLPGLARVNTELERLNRDLNDFAYIISHDLRAPLRGLRTVSEWIEEYLKEPTPEMQENLALMRERVDHLDMMIQGVLRYSRAGRRNVASEPLHTHVITEQIIANLNPPEGIAVQIPRELPVIWYDTVQFEQIMQNLIENALKYMGSPSGTVTVRASSRGEFWSFEVSDTGVGIAPEHHERIFKMFQRLEDGEASGSSGIGLAVVKRAVEEMGGSIQLVSKPGAGSSFFFTVPKRPVSFEAAKAAGLLK